MGTDSIGGREGIVPGGLWLRAITCLLRWCWKTLIDLCDFFINKPFKGASWLSS